MSIFKEPLSTSIREQLMRRGDSFKNRTPKDITYINSRNAWIRMTSGVNINGNSIIASQNILQGGVLYDNKLRSGVGGETSAYSNININGERYLTGINPMAGITNVSIKSLGAYGSLREAIVEFECNDIKQLEVLELLYMRPGFSVLLEWGWIPYLNNEGNIVNNVKFYDDIFTLNPKQTFNERCAVLYKKTITETNGNYDALLGYIKNYKWTSSENGSYKCSINLISLGEIVESLKINYSSFFGDNSKNFILYPKIIDQNNFIFSVDNIQKNNADVLKSYIGAEKNIRDTYSRSTLAGILSEIYLITEKIGSSADKGQVVNIDDLNGTLTGVKNHKIHMFVWDIDVETADKDNKNNKTTDFQVYIDLDSFCKIFTKNITLSTKNSGENKPLIELSVKDREYLELDKELLCLADPLQLSVNPLTCLIKNPNWGYSLRNLPSNVEFKDRFNVQNILPVNDIDYIEARTAINKYLVDPQYNLNYIISYLNRKTKSTTETTILNSQNQNKKYLEILSGAWEDYKLKNITIDQDIIYINYPNKTGDPAIKKSNNSEDIKNFSFIDVLYQYNSNDVNLIFGRVFNPLQNKAYYESVIQADSNIQNQFNNQLDEIVNRNKVIINTKQIIERANKSLLPLDKLTKDYFYKDENNNIRQDLGTIGGIYINVGYLINQILNIELENQDFKEKKEINLYDYLKNIISEVQSSIGNINNFDIFVDPIDNKARIIDINYVTEKNNEKVFEEAFTFLTNRSNQFDGLYNNIRDYEMSSRIFKEQSTIVAISAQNGGGEMGIDNTTLVGWNQGLTDRIKPDVGVPTLPSYTNEKSVIFNNISDSCITLADFFNDLSYKSDDNIFSFFSYRNREIKLDRIDEYKSALRDIISTLKALTLNNIKYKAIIPTVISLETDGIGGLIIGNIFRMPDDLMPKGYKGEEGIGRKLGFIITSINHRLENNDWITNIEGQTIILENPKNDIEYSATDILSKAINDSLNPKQISTATEKRVEKINQSAQSNVQIVYNFIYDKLSNEGYQGDKHLQTSALLGVLMLESGPNINPAAINAKSGAWGIAQWLGSRKNKLFATYGKTTILQQQLDFLWLELNTTEKSAKNRWLKATNLTEAVVGFAYYERAEEFDKNGILNRNHPNIIARTNFAYNIFNSVRKK